MIPDEYFDLSAPMGLGKRYRHPNCCEGKDRALVITRTPTGWDWFCHRCRKGGKKYLEGMSPDQYRRWKAQEVKPIQTVRKVLLPLDFTRQIPVKGLAWLYRYGITDTNIEVYRFGFSKYYNRLIMPIFRGPELLYWSGRNLGEASPKNPKYMNVRSLRDDIWFERSDHGREHVVLVEDILSAIRVGHHVDTRAVLYASVPDRLILQLVRMGYKQVHIWLDPDKADVMYRYVNRFRTFGINCVMHITKQDPKYYSDEEIVKEVIG